MQKWIVIPKNSPDILRNCPKCNTQRRYYNSGNFRINANGKQLDVWLIYRCKACDSTWNMTILTRVKPQDIAPALYQSFLNNDSTAAMQFAFDKPVLAQNFAAADYTGVEYYIEKQRENENGLEICCAYDFNLRLDKFLSHELQISRAKVRLLLEANSLSAKTKLHGKLILKEFFYEKQE